MIKLVPTVTYVESTPGAEVSASGSGPALTSRSTTYPGARRPAPVRRMLLLTLLAPALAEEETPEPTVRYDAFPVLF